MAGLPEGMELLDLLRDAGLVADDHYQRAIHEAQRSGDRMEEVLIRIRALGETALLGVLAKRYKTQFVGTDKLARATPDARTLEAIPRHLVDSLKVFPLHYRRRTQTLSCASFDLERRDVANQLRVATGIREVKVFVARPLAVQAMIAKHYAQDPKPLQHLLQLRRSEPAPTIDVDKDLADFASGYGVGGAGGLDPLAARPRARARDHDREEQDPERAERAYARALVPAGRDEDLVRELEHGGPGAVACARSELKAVVPPRQPHVARDALRPCVQPAVVEPDQAVLVDEPVPRGHFDPCVSELHRRVRCDVGRGVVGLAVHEDRDLRYGAIRI